MQRVGILNSAIAKVLADLGHTDTIVIADCGLPVLPGVLKIDLALRLGEPAFADVLAEVLQYMKVERATIATEMETRNGALRTKTLDLLGDIPCDACSHEELKRRTAAAKAVIRTGENTPYANIILQSDCIF